MSAQLPWIKLQDGSLYNLDTGAEVRPTGKFISVKRPGHEEHLLDCLDATAAATCHTALQTAASPIVAPAATAAPAIVWTSVTPDEMAIGTNSPALTIVGTGLATARINRMKLVNGTDVAECLPVLISDTEIDLNAETILSVATGTYTIYFSVDGGATWTTTGLTVDATALVWTSITPNTATAGATFGAVVAGTGFATAGFSGSAFRLNDGVGSAYRGLNVVDSDIQITLSAFVPYPAGTYTLEFTTNDGVAWTTTGLTVTVT